MPLPIASAACVHVTATSQGMKIRLPGGAELAPNLPSADFPSLLDVTKGLLAQVNTALAPLVPVFNVIDLGLSLFNFAKAAATLSVGDMVEALKKVAENADKLLGLIPQLSVPVMILDIVDMLLATLNGIVGELNVMAQEVARIDAARVVAENLENAEMTAILDCAQENIDAQISSLNEGLAPLNRLLGLLNILIALVPGDIIPALPTFDTLGGSVAEALAKIQAALVTLQNIRNAIPI